ncbi:MAG: NapC/NirT family cytochrome c [Candidatus Latescibacteria bacterium]|nr:NapC/NirT family cytochrome c [Candidatus Latescibacterota bacterium]
MVTPLALLIILIAFTMGLILTIAVRPPAAMERGGRIMAFLSIFLLPLVIGWAGMSEHIELSKKTEFCLSCHPMADYGKSLYVDDNEFVPAQHFQNNRIPREQACYTCHTDYTLYGDISAKIRGVKHVYAQYFGTAPQTLKLYTPYNNRECLHCHAGSRSFEESKYHRKDETTLAAVKVNELSCLSSNCHDVIHNVKELQDVEFWKPGIPPKRAQADTTATQAETQE